MTLDIRDTIEDDWQELRRTRLAALRDAPTAFGVTHASAAAYTDDAWRDRAAGRGPARYILALDGKEAVGIVAHVPNAKLELEMIAMWVAPSQRGTPTATRLVDGIKAYAIENGYSRVLLGVSPDNARLGFLSKTRLHLPAAMGSAGEPPRYSSAENGMGQT